MRSQRSWPFLLFASFTSLRAGYVTAACTGSSVPTVVGATTVSGSPKPHAFEVELGHESVENLFFIGHSRTCNEERSLAQFLAESDSFVLPDYDEKDHVVATLAANHSLMRSPMEYAGPVHNASHFHTPLKNLRMEHRRDFMLAALELAVEHKKSQLQARRGGLRRLQGVTDRPSLSKVYLSKLDVDVVHGDTLPDHGARHLAAALPCLSFPPEQNMPRYPTHLPQQPNDLREDWRGQYDQWHLVGSLEGEKAGTNALDGWACVTGQEVKTVIAVVDTGCSMHPDLEHNLCKPTESCAGYDFGDGDNNPYDEPLSCMHGTTVSGTIAAVTNNKFGLAGVCWGCRLSCLKIWNHKHQGMSTYSIQHAIDYIIGKGIRISNHSYLGYGSSPAELQAHQHLEKAGHITVIAAGNDHCNLDYPYSTRPDACKDKHGRPLGPGTPVSYALSNMIVVGATARDNTVAWFSNYSNRLVHLMAPGEKLTLLANTLKMKSGVAISSGTSFSAPIVAGVVGLIWSRAPHLTYTQVKDLILNNVDHDPQYTGYCATAGRLNIDRTLRALNLPCNNPDVATIPVPRHDNTATYYADGSASAFPLAATISFTLLLASWAN